MGKQTFQVGIEFIGNINNLLSQVKSATGEIERMSQAAGGSQLQQQFNSLTKTIQELQAQAQQPISSQAEFNKLENGVRKAETAYHGLLTQIERMKSASDSKKLELLPQDQQAKIKAAEQALATYESRVGKVAKKQAEFNSASDKVKGMRSVFQGVATSLGKAEKEASKLSTATANLASAQEAYEKLFYKSGARAGQKKDGVSDEQIAQATQRLSQARAEAEKLSQGYTSIGDAASAAGAKVRGLSSQKLKLGADLKTAEAGLERIEQELTELKTKLNTTSGDQLKSAFDELKSKAQELGVSLEGIDDVSSIDTLTQRLRQLKESGLTEADAALDRFASNLRGNVGTSLNQTKTQITQLRQEFDRFSNKLNEINQLKSYVTYFFSLTNAVYIFRNTLTKAFETVKELDKSMTETAVVTDFSINDMWEKLPEYTKNASALGATTKQLYDATTLYYQQGLKGNEVMAVGMETMKMARIANMDAADATKAMTAALRGFNMEVNNTNATRVNDVYSQLAAITASDTSQIATAMEKTASIAKSANMEFETTAALLAQIIETTQEAPETAGTAMKTIIARFSEVKSLREQGKKTGQDEEGEEIDVNKIQTALKSVGISMNDFFAGTEGLDSILMKLAEKWQDLDFETQRYIATMAAGSRQQSRFIAMMSDYKRTVELVDAANNSAGASQRQYEKTLDSLDSKLNQLSNSWNQFVMGLANNEYIKLAVDMLTGLLDIVNWIIDELGKVVGTMDGASSTVDNLTKSLLTLLTVYGAIRAGGFLLNKGFDKVVTGVTEKKNAAEQKLRAKNGNKGVDNGQSLETSAQTAGQTLENSARTAGETFEAAVKRAAGVEETSATTEAGIEEGSAATQGQMGIANEEAKNQVGVTGELQKNKIGAAGEMQQNEIGLTGEVQQNQVGLAGSTAESEIEITTAELEGQMSLFNAEDRALIETTAATQAGAIENEAAVAEGLVENETALSEGLVEVGSAELEGQIGIAAAFSESEIEVAGALTETELEEIGATVEAVLEEQSAIKEEAIEHGGGKWGNFKQGVGQKWGSIKSGVGGFFKTYGGAIASFASIAASIVLVAATVNALKEKIDGMGNTTSEQLESLGVVEGGLVTKTQQLSEELSNFGQKKANLTKMVDSLSSLKRGSADWASTLHQARSEMGEILATYPELKQYVETINGVSTLTQEGWDKYEELLKNSYNESMMALYAVRMQQLQVNQKAAAEGIAPTTDITAAEEEKLTKYTSTATTIGGAAGGLIGTIWGPVGTIIGTALGTLIGAGVGILLGDGFTMEDGFEVEAFNAAAEAAGTYMNEDGTAFSAEFATDEQLRKYAEDMAKLYNINADELEEYLKENGKAFDSHTQSLIEAKQKLREFGEQLGYIVASDANYDQENADNVARIAAVVSEESYQETYDAIRASYDRELTDAERTKGAKLINEDYSYNAATKTYVDGSGQKVELVDDNIKDALAASETGKIIGEMAERRFEFVRGLSIHQSDVTAISHLINGESIRELTYNQLFGSGNILGFDAETGEFNFDNSKVVGQIEDQLGGLNTALTTGTKVIDVLGSTAFHTIASWGGRSVPTTTENGVPTMKQVGDFTFNDDTNGETLAYYMPWRNQDELRFEGLTKEEVAWYLGQKGYKGLGSVTTDESSLGANDHPSYQPDVTRTFEEIFEAGGTGLSLFHYAYGFLKDPQIKDKMTTPENIKFDINDEVFYEAVAKEFGVDRAVAEAWFAGNTSIEEFLNIDEVKAVYAEMQPIIDQFAFLGNVSMATAKQFHDHIQTLVEGTKLTEEQAKALIYDPLNAIYDSIPDVEVAYEVISRAAMLDFTNLNELEQFKSWMKTLPGVSDEALEAFDGTIEGLEELGIAYARIDLETVIEQLDKLNKVINKINNLKVGDNLTFTEDELNAMLTSQSGLSRKDFFSTSDGFVYLGDSMNDLRDTLLETNRILLDQQLDAFRTKLGMAENIREANLTDISWGTVSTWQEKEYGQLVKQGADNLGITFDEIKDENGNVVGYNAKRMGADGKWITGQAALAGTLFENMDVNTFADLYHGRAISEYALEGIKGLGTEWADAWMNQASYSQQYATGAQTQKENYLSGLTVDEILAVETTTMVGDKAGAGEVITFDSESGVTPVVDQNGIIQYKKVLGKDPNGTNVYAEATGLGLETENGQVRRKDENGEWLYGDDALAGTKFQGIGASSFVQMYEQGYYGNLYGDADRGYYDLSGPLMTGSSVKTGEVQADGSVITYDAVTDSNGIVQYNPTEDGSGTNVGRIVRGAGLSTYSSYSTDSGHVTYGFYKPGENIQIGGKEISEILGQSDDQTAQYYKDTFYDNQSGYEFWDDEGLGELLTDHGITYEKRYDADGNYTHTEFYTKGENTYYTDDEVAGMFVGTELEGIDPQAIGQMSFDYENDTYDLTGPKTEATTHTNIVMGENGSWQEVDSNTLSSGYTTQDIDRALEAKLIDANLVGYRDYLVETEGISKQMAARIALQNQEMAEGVNLLAAGYENWAAEMERGPASPKYHQSLAELRNAATKLLGSTEGLSDEWLSNSENMALFERAAKGDLKAIDALRKSAAKEIVLQTGIAEDGIDSTEQQLLDTIAAFDGESIEIGTSLNDTALYDAFNAMIAAGKMTSAEVQDALDEIGFEPQFETETYTITDTDMQNGYVRIPRVDASGNVTYVDEPISGSMSVGSTITIPKIIGKNSDGTGGQAAVTGTYRGSATVTAPKPSGGGGGGSEKWENPYDEFYNTVEKINEELRKREKLELRYQRLLDRNAATAAEIARLTREQIASLRVERGDREGLLRGRERQMRDIENEYSDVGKYAWYNEEKGQIEIDWNLLEELDGSTDEDLTERVDEYISKLEEQQDLIEEEQDALQEIQDAIWEIYQQGKDEYFDLEDQIKEAIIADRQKEIDKLSEINDSINDTNSRLLDSIQERLDEYRQNRENQKTEEELSDKQRRLAYLQQDTSGANALEIMQLQEELDEATEDYTDTLIDQKISELQEQNDKAAEQRQQQIDIMQAQLDQYSESAAIWEEVNSLMNEGLDPESGLVRGSRLEELLKSTDGFDGMSKLKQMDWLNELNNNVAQALAWLEGGALQNLFGEGGEVTFTDKDGNTVTGKIDENGDVVTEDGRVYSGDKFKIDQNGNIISYETGDEARTNWENAQAEEEPTTSAKGKLASLPSSTRLSSAQVKKLQGGLNDLLADGELSGFKKLAVDGSYGSLTRAAVKKLQAKIGTSADGSWGPKTKAAFDASNLTAYKTGGLADFTGPAWLDGTKSKPEYILNADQTKAFFTLVDVLSGLNMTPSKATEKTGDNTYDIDINVESIGSDYDVEQLATTVKRLINEDARYRNNNTINLTR